MKKFIVATAIAAVVSMAAFKPAKANGGPHTWFAGVDHTILSDSKFNVSFDKQAADDIVILHIDNPEKKNLSVSLNGPDGIMIDNFSTGRKYVKTSKNYNFSGAEEGMYTLVISDGRNRIKHNIKFERITPKALTQLTIQ